MRALFLLLVLLLTACQGTAVTPSPAPQETTAPVDTAAPATEGPAPTLSVGGTPIPPTWKIFAEPNYGYSFALPPEWEECTTTEYSHVFCEPQSEPGVGPLPSLYISVIPQGFDNSGGEVYNFMQEEVIQSFFGLPQGEAQLIEPNATPPEYFTYTRLPDQWMGGLPALVIENTKVWEAPPGTKDRRVLLVTDRVDYLLGAYYETLEELETFETILASFRFLPMQSNWGPGLTPRQ